MLPLLAAAGFDTLAFDQRGQYESPGLDEDDYSLAGFADDAMALIEAAFRTEPIHVLGHSFGGLVAQNLALRHSDRITTLSLLSSGPGALGDSETRPLQRMVNAIGRFPLPDIHEMRDNGVRRPAQIAAFLAKRFADNNPVSLKTITQHLLNAPDQVDEVAALGLPVWVGRGEFDDAWPHDNQAKMAERLGTEIVVIPEAAHSPGVEQPEELVTAWLPFLNAHT